MKYFSNVSYWGLFAKMIFTISFFCAQNSLALKLYNTGSTADVSATTSQLICLAGGGNDDLWATGWKAMLTAAGGGDVVIIRADGSRGGYESWIYNDDSKNGFPKVNSVKVISLTKAADANRADVEQLILNAELVFFSGGDQSVYINWFRGSKLAEAVDYVMKVKKVPVGGTSAGMALLAGIDYSANYSSPSKKNAMVTADDVLKDPTGIFVDLDRTVLTPPFMNQVITDTHFSQRNRQGRLMGFMARAVYNNYGDVFYNNVKGIGADEGTAVCYNSAGQAQVHGAGNAYFLKGNSQIERLRVGYSLDWFANRQAVSAYVINGSQTQSAQFDLGSWVGVGGVVQNWWVDGFNQLAPLFGID